MHSLTCITRLFSKGGKNCNALKKDSHSKGSTLVATPQVKDDKALTLSHQCTQNKKLKKQRKTSKKSFKTNKAKPKGIKVKTKL